MNIKYSSTKTNKTTTNYCSEIKNYESQGGTTLSMVGPLMRGGGPPIPSIVKNTGGGGQVFPAIT